MDLRVYYDQRCLQHDNGPGHPERSERVAAIMRRVEAGEYGVAHEIRSCDPVDRIEIERVHTAGYTDELEASAERERTVFDADTSANRHSWLAARLAAGGAVAATRAAIAGESVYSFVAMRPPGHHAETDRAMGFCLLNNAAIAAADALAAGITRVAIIDWDVHHGNGTEHIFADRSDVFYVSLHQAPHYPGTGRSTDVGLGAGAGYTMNVPLPAGSGEGEYLRAIDELVVPILSQYGPQLVLVSAGFDAHERDPLAGMLLGAVSYRRITERLRAFADEVATRRIVHLLEGGYDLEALSSGVHAVLEALSSPDVRVGRRGLGDDRAPDDRSAGGSAADLAASALDETRAALSPYWEIGNTE
ncbi:MAG TPA: histone deacetylase [Spirochaetia bacterium]|nr:histone deacetylase [Spirochaetia bacterium]